MSKKRKKKRPLAFDKPIILRYVNLCAGPTARLSSIREPHPVQMPCDLMSSVA